MFAYQDVLKSVSIVKKKRLVGNGLTNTNLRRFCTAIAHIQSVIVRVTKKPSQIMAHEFSLWMFIRWY